MKSTLCIELLEALANNGAYESGSYRCTDILTDAGQRCWEAERSLFMLQIESLMKLIKALIGSSPEK